MSRCMNLEGRTERVSMRQLSRLRDRFLKFISPDRGRGISEWFDASFEGDGFNVVFEDSGKVFRLRCECIGEA